MSAEYHRKIFEIQQAISKREMHRLEIEKELLRVRNRKEANNEKLRHKLRKLKQEVVEDERNHRRSVEVLLNKIKSQKKEYEILQTKTSQIRAKKDRSAFINSLQDSLKSKPIGYNQLYWPTQDSSSQTEPETLKITEGTQITPRIVSFQSENALSMSQFYNYENVPRFHQNMPFAKQVSNELFQSKQLNYNDNDRRDPYSNSSYQQQLQSSNITHPSFSSTQNLENSFRIKNDIPDAIQAGLTSHYRRPQSEVTFKGNEISDTIKEHEIAYSEQKVICPEENEGKDLHYSHITGNNDKVTENKHISPSFSSIAQNAEHVKTQDTISTSSSSDEKENIPVEPKNHSRLNYDERSTESNSRLESKPQNSKSDTSKLKKKISEPLKLVSFTPHKNKPSDEENDQSNSVKVSEEKIQNDKEKKILEKQLSIHSNLDQYSDSLKSPIHYLETSTEKSKIDIVKTIPNTDDNRTAQKNVRLEDTKSNNTDNINSCPKSKAIDQSEQPSKISSPQPAPEISINSPEVEKNNDSRGAKIKPATALLKTPEFTKNKQEKYDYERDIFDECIPTKSTDAYKQMLRIISNEPLHDDDDDGKRISPVTNPTLNELANYDAESIDSVEAAIQAATKGAEVKIGESDSSKSNSSRTEAKPAASSSPVSDPQEVLKSASEVGNPESQIKKTLFSKSFRANDPLKISLDSDSESLSPVSAGDDPTDNDDSFL